MNKEKLLDRFGEAYKNDGFPPLAGKIMGLFYISNQKHFNFEEIVCEVGATKGAVSKNIKLLFELNWIEYVLKNNGSRKRHCFLDIHGVKYFLRLVIENYKEQDKLLKECANMRNNDNEELNNFIQDSIQFNEEVLAFLDLKSEQYFK